MRTQRTVFRQAIDVTGDNATDHVTTNQCINPTIATSTRQAAARRASELAKREAVLPKPLNGSHLKT
jgi:hypothetical protein